jgi:hypothetical protein
MKKIRFRIEYLLKYWNYLKFLRTNGILVFCQNLSLNPISDLTLSTYFKDVGYRWKFLNKAIIVQLLDKKFLRKINSFRKVILINDVKEISNLEKFLKKNKILILGYYMENIFFFKKDFNIKQTEKEYLFYSLKNRLVNFSFLNKKIISNIKFLSIKLILLLKKNIELNK